MKIAVSSEGKKASGHFGHCEGFTMYEVEDDKILNTEFIPNPGHRQGFLPVFLKEKGTNVIISGGMGGTAQQLFQDNEIQVIVGVTGNCDDIIKDYIDGKLKSTGSICEEHTYEGHCGE